MKKIVFISCAIALLGCKEQIKPDYAIISGTISNRLPNELTINTYDQSYREVINVSEDGSFKDTLGTDRSSYILFDGKNPVFLHVEPGYELNINYNAQDFNNSLQISGDGAEISKYLSEKRKLEQKLFGNAKVTYTLDEASYKNKMNSIKDEQVSLLKSFNGIPENFVVKEIKNINYNYLRLLSIYEQAYRQLAQKPDFNASTGFLDELDHIDYNNIEDFEFSIHYKSLVARFYKKKADSLSIDEEVSNDIAHLKTLANIDNEIIKNGLLFDFANYNMVRSADVDAFYKLFSDNSTDESNNKLIKEKYNKITALNVGKRSPEFVDYKNYKGGTTSLNDLKGKYLYIDVWATWCGPCVREIPALKKVEEQYHDKNIEFVSISIDKESDFEKWKTMVSDRELKGVQLFADRDWNSSFVKDYGIQGIPRFILLDPEGKIVNTNAPRPSDPALIDLFSELKI
ncbi:TlpA family protein disulfide reductase [Flavisericum labens]|uniref:TlpA family protein disulfide reductase n=1 Tax=Flavisericum labens TaxID=3377112 RepID=UPI00387B111A